MHSVIFFSGKGNFFMGHTYLEGDRMSGLFRLFYVWGLGTEYSRNTVLTTQPAEKHIAGDLTGFSRMD